MNKFIIFCSLSALVLAGCMTGAGYNYKTNTRPYTIAGETYYPMASANGYTETGNASWYGPGFHGKKTASGEVFNQNALTAAHKTLPFGTKLKVTNLDNGLCANVIVNDRGPFKKNRIIDLSRAAAKRLDMLKTGTARVRIESVGTYNTSVTTAKNTTKGMSNGVSGTYYVQVGAFSDQRNATNVEKKLSAQGYQHRTKNTNGKHIVQVGPYTSRARAESVRDTLRSKYADAFIVE